MKAQTDVLFIIVMIFVIAIIGLFASYLWTQFEHSAPFIFNASVGNSTVANTIGAAGTGSINTFNNAIILIFIFAAVASAISAAFVESNPLFFGVGIIIIIIEIVFSVMLHNIFFSIVQNSFLATTLLQYTYMLILFEYFPLFCFLIGLFILIFTYAKGSNGIGV